MISSNSTLFEVYDFQQIGFLACQDHSNHLNPVRSLKGWDIWKHLLPLQSFLSTLKIPTLAIISLHFNLSNTSLLL